MTANNPHNDESFMRQALALAAIGIGRVAPNPSVGCVIVKDNHIIAQARTADGGRPHAEAQALSIAGNQARGATAYVSLEPCAHHGKTPPCAQALIDAGIGRVVIACGDDDPRVSGQGIATLRQAGIPVDEGCLEHEALALNAGFFKAIKTGVPWVTLKMAVSGNGKIALHGGQPVQISSDESIRHMHAHVRARHDAIMVGARTAINDDPSLTTRYLPEGIDYHNPIRLVAARSDIVLRQDSNLRKGNNSAIIVDGRDLQSMLADIYQQYGITRLLVEGGAQLMAAFLTAGLWDELYLYQNPQLSLPDDAVDAPNFDVITKHLQETKAIGTETLAIYRARD